MTLKTITAIPDKRVEAARKEDRNAVVRARSAALHPVAALVFAALTAIGLSASDGAVAQEAPADPAAAFEGLAGLSGQERIDAMVTAAAEEDGIIIYGATGLDRGQFWVEQFNEAYPDLSAEFVRLTETDLVQKLTAEYQTGNSVADVVIETSTYLPLISHVLSPYKVTADSEIDDRFKYSGEGWSAYAYEVFPESVAWRTDTLDGETPPADLEELAEWGQGRNIGTTPNIARLGTGLVEVYGEEKAEDVLEKLASLNNKVFNSHSALSDALAAGEVDVAWDLVASRPIGLKDKGAPIEWVLMEPTFGESNTISVVKDTASPYTAALFVDTIMSKEVLEASDAWQAGRFFGNTAGEFDMSLSDYPDLKLFPVVDAKVLEKWQLLGERLFIRRQ